MYYNYNDHSTDMNRQVLGSINEFNKYYSVITSHHINEASTKEILFYKVYDCRFCKKDISSTSFKKEAHALPNLIGNKVLFSHIECDNCNEKFGKLLETEFGKYMHLNHTISGVKGKKGYRKFTMDNAKIVTTETLIDWKDIPEENYNYDTAAGILTIKQKMPSFIPIAVYKCFVKIALTIMPENELVNFEDSLKWINEDSHRGSSFNFKQLVLLQGTVSTSNKFTGISAILIRRKESTDKKHPYMVLQLTYGCFLFTVPLPLSIKDETISSTNIPYIPNIIDLEFGYGNLDLKLMNLHSFESIKGAEMTVKITDLDHSGTIEMIEENDL